MNNLNFIKKNKIKIINKNFNFEINNQNNFNETLNNKITLIDEKANKIEKCQTIVNAFKNDWNEVKKQIEDTYFERINKLNSLEKILEKKEEILIKNEEISNKNIELLIEFDNLIEQKNILNRIILKFNIKKNF